MAGLFQRLDTHMVDSHLMLSAMKLTSKIRRNYPAKWARDAANDPEYLGTLWRLGTTAGTGPGGATKGKGQAPPQNPPPTHVRGKPFAYRARPSRSVAWSPH